MLDHDGRRAHRPLPQQVLGAEQLVGAEGAHARRPLGVPLGRGLVVVGHLHGAEDDEPDRAVVVDDAEQRLARRELALLHERDEARHQRRRHPAEDLRLLQPLRRHHRHEVARARARREEPVEVVRLDLEQPRPAERDGLALERDARQQRHLAEELPAVQHERVDHVLDDLAALLLLAAAAATRHHAAAAAAAAAAATTTLADAVAETLAQRGVEAQADRARRDEVERRLAVELREDRLARPVRLRLHHIDQRLELVVVKPLQDGHDAQLLDELVVLLLPHQAQRRLDRRRLAHEGASVVEAPVERREKQPTKDGRADGGPYEARLFLVLVEDVPE